MASPATSEVLAQKSDISPDIDCSKGVGATSGEQTSESSETAVKVKSGDSIPTGTRNLLGETDTDCPTEELRHCCGHVERRLSCQELETILDKLAQLINTPLELPKNKGQTLDCHIRKDMSLEETNKKIDRILEEAKAWLDDLGPMLKEHAESHCLYSPEYPTKRQMDKETWKNRHDSGICSQEIPPNIPNGNGEGLGAHEIEELKDDQARSPETDSDESPRSDDESRSLECNKCADYGVCRCQGLSADEVEKTFSAVANLLDCIDQDD